MKTLKILFASLCCLMLLSAGEAWAETSWDSHPSSTTDSTAATAIGNGFTVYSSGESITSLTVYVGTNAVSNASLKIYSGHTGTAGTLVGTGATGISGSSGSTLTITLTNPIAVEPGQYTWMLEQASNFNLLVSTTGNGVFSGGDLTYGSSAPLSEMDARFIMYAGDPSVPLMGRTGLALFGLCLLGAGAYAIRRNRKRC